MVASTVKNANDHLRKGNNERKKARQYLAYVPGVHGKGILGARGRRENPPSSHTPRVSLAFCIEGSANA